MAVVRLWSESVKATYGSWVQNGRLPMTVTYARGVHPKRMFCTPRVKSHPTIRQNADIASHEGILGRPGRQTENNAYEPTVPRPMCAVS